MITPEIKKAIYSMNKEDVSEMYNLLNARRKSIEMLKGAEFRRGQMVEFTARGTKWQGSIERINKVSLTVRTVSPKVGSGRCPQLHARRYN